MATFRYLIKNGHSTAVNIPPAYLHHLGWYSGEQMVIELDGDSAIRIRRPELKDVQRPQTLFATLPAPEPVAR